jgi:hypothetical protein
MPIMNDYKRMPLISSGEWKVGEPETCTWRQGNRRNLYYPSCRRVYSLSNEKTLSESKLIFCPFCGKPIKDIPYSG